MQKPQEARTGQSRNPGPPGSREDSGIQPDCMVGAPEGLRGASRASRQPSCPEQVLSLLGLKFFASCISRKVTGVHVFRRVLSSILQISKGCFEAVEGEHRLHVSQRLVPRPSKCPFPGSRPDRR